jgi:hypothetical protein
MAYIHHGLDLGIFAFYKPLFYALALEQPSIFYQI